MEKIFIQVYTEKRFPEKTGLYHTNRGMINYFAGLKTFEHSIAVDYWLEEIELPTDKEIDSTYPLQWGSDMMLFNTDARKGAKWMRDYILKNK